MSDPQINIEIEDVLASIRRLVSEGEVGRVMTGDAAAEPILKASVDATGSDRDDARRAVSVVAPRETANSPQAPEKLILSPDLMVKTPTSPLLLTPDDEAPVDEGASVELQPIAEVTTDVTADVTEWQSVRQSPLHAGLSGAEARSQLLSTIVELEAAVTETSEEFEPDGSEVTPVVDWAKTTENGAIFGARAATTRVVDLGFAADTGVAPSGTQPQSVDVETAVEDIAQAVADAGAASIETRLDAELSGYVAAGEAVDQTALRAMVGDIVREELQGALGVRITRNVRKLVRREIYRVLSSEDLS